MKKHLIFILLFILPNLLIIAQEKVDLNPTAKNFSVEVDFTPFNQTTPISINSFKGKYFIDNKTALRIGFNFDNGNNSFEEPASTNSDSPLYDKTSEKYTVFGISPGFEIHFLESTRVSPYFGFQINYENKISKATYEEYERGEYNGNDYDYTLNKTEYKNSWRTISTYTQNTNWGTQTYTSQGIGERGYSSLGANLILGADFYIVKHLYLGLELGFGYNSVRYKEIEIDSESAQDVVKYPESKTSEFGLNVNNAIRLGFWF